MKSRLALLLSALTLTVPAVYAQAQAPSASATRVDVGARRAPASLEDYLKLPQYANPTLSPDGRYLAVSTPVKGRLNLAVVDLETRKGTALTNFSDFDVLDARWAGNERLVFTLGQANSPTGPGQFNGGGLFVVSRDGTTSRKLAGTIKESRGNNSRYRELEMLRSIPGSSDEILASGNLRADDSEDVYRLNLLTGRSTLVSSDRPTRTFGWVLDNKLVPRVVNSQVKDTLTFLTFYRAAEDQPWKEIARTDRTEGTGFRVLGFMSDNRSLMVATNAGRDTVAVYRFDPDTKTLGELLVQHPKFDMGADSQSESVPGVVTEPDTDRVLGYVVDAERPQTVWIDEKEAKTQAVVDGALPGTRNTFRRFPNSARLLVQSYSDVSPAKFYLLDEGKRTLEELFSSKPWLDADKLVEMRPFLLKTRDGLEIPSYYFLPKSYKPGDRLPTVVHIHGGPSARADHWARGFGYLEAEILASRGYAVVLPNFRVTPGFGSKIFKAGFGTLGRQMSEDHEDAAKWAIDQGFAEPGRICMSGASYGGYAVLRALAKSPELFKCGVAGLVVSDVEMQATSLAGDTARSPIGYQFWVTLAGKNADGKPAFRETSPAFMADKIKAPVFMYAGADDIRTPLEQTTAMVRALERAGNPPKSVIIKAEEGHGYGKLENNVDLYERMLKFLDDSIGSGAK